MQAGELTMWPLPRIRNEQVTLILDGNSMSIGWVNARDRYPCALQAYQSYSLDTMHSPLINKYVAQFIADHNLSRAMMRVTLAHPFIYEQFVRLCKTNLSDADLGTPELKQMLWDYRYIHTLDDGNHLFYVCAIKRAGLFAQQLLAHRVGCHLQTITTEYMAIAQAYRALFGPAFRQSHIAIQMLKHHYHLHQSMSADSVARLLHIAPHLTIDINAHKKSLLAMIGLCYQEREKI